MMRSLCCLALLSAAFANEDATVMMQKAVKKDEKSTLDLDMDKIMEGLPKGAKDKLKGINLKGLDISKLDKLMPLLSQIPGMGDIGSALPAGAGAMASGGIPGMGNIGNIDPMALMALLPKIPIMLQDGTPYLQKVLDLVTARHETLTGAGQALAKKESSLVETTAKDPTEAIKAFVADVSEEIKTAEDSLTTLEKDVDDASETLLIPVIDKILADLDQIPKNISKVMIAPILKSVMINPAQREVLANTTAILDRIRKAASEPAVAAQIINVDLEDWLAEQSLKMDEDYQNGAGLLEALFAMLSDAPKEALAAKDIMSSVLFEVKNSAGALVNSTDKLVKDWNFNPAGDKSQAIGTRLGFGLIAAAAMAAMF